MEQIYNSEMKRNLDALIVENKLLDKSISIFGHCNATEEMVDYLVGCGILVTAILDNNEAKIGLTYHSVQTVKPSFIQGYTSENSVVLIATRFYDAMCAQLRRLGYDGQIIKIVDYNSFSEYSLSEETVARKKERVLRGDSTMERVRQIYPGHHLVVCPYNALGDIYWAMAFLPEYLAKHRIEQAVIVVTGGGSRQVAEMFGYNQIISLEHGEMDEFIQALIFTREGNSIIAHHDRPYTDNIIKYLDRKLLPFIDYYRYAVYGLSRNDAPVVPAHVLEYEKKEQLMQGKTVIMAPYAKSIVQMPDSYWKDIVQQYQKKGYLVCTNVNGKEKTLEGTVPLSIPLNQMISAVEYAGHFIGIRSGLCDVIHTAKCRKTVVFPDNAYSSTPFMVKDFFWLPDWDVFIRK